MSTPCHALQIQQSSSCFPQWKFSKTQIGLHRGQSVHTLNSGLHVLWFIPFFHVFILVCISCVKLCCHLFCCRYWPPTTTCLPAFVYFGATHPGHVHSHLQLCTYPSLAFKSPLSPYSVPDCHSISHASYPPAPPLMLSLLCLFGPCFNLHPWLLWLTLVAFVLEELLFLPTMPYFTLCLVFS